MASRKSRRKAGFKLPVSWRKRMDGAAGGVLLALLLAAIVFAPGLLTALGRQPSSVALTTGYNRLVDLISAKGWLAVEYADEGPPSVGWSALAPREGEAIHPILRRFERASYLGRDFASADASIWRFDRYGEQVEGILPAAHRIGGPFTGLSDWRGDLLFRDGARPVPILTDLAGGGRVSLSGPTGAGPMVLPLGRRLSGEASAQAVEFQLRDRTRVAAVLRVGDKVLVRTLGVDGVEVSVEGGGRKLGEADAELRELRPGEVLRIRREGSAPAHYLLSNGSTAISTYQTQQMRVRDPSLTSIARGVEGAVDPRVGDVRTTLDRNLQGLAQTALEDTAERLRLKPGDPGRGAPFPAAVTIMNARTGEVLALATYPARREQLDRASRRSVREHPLLERNQNFVRLPIGSVAKAPFSAAILQHHPVLATLQIERAWSGGFRTVMGVDLRAQFHEGVDSGSGLMAYPEFLARSSNKFAAALMLLALANDPAATLATPSERWVLDGQGRAAAPDVWPYVDLTLPTGPNGLTFVTRPGPPAWTAELGGLFDLRYESRLSDREQEYDVDLWGGLADTPARKRAFAVIAPEREVFGMNVIQNVASDYMMTILGGSRSRWTSLKVAEVFSRIVTRTPVQARLYGAALPAPGQRLFENTPAWEMTMTGLNAVTRSDQRGTAGVLSTIPMPDVAGGRIELFAKTGTPDIDRMETAGPGERALRRFVEGGCGLVFERGRLVAADARGARSAQDFAAAFANRRLACFGVRDESELVWRELRRRNSRLAAGESLPSAFTVAPDGRVTGMTPQMTPGSGHAIALVAARYREGASRADGPERALTIVVNVQHRGEEDRAPAREVAEKLLRDPRVQAWLAQSEPKPQARP